MQDVEIFWRLNRMNNRCILKCQIITEEMQISIQFIVVMQTIIWEFNALENKRQTKLC